MNLYNFTLDRDKLLHQIKARNFTWFLSIACVSCYGPEKVSFKDSGMAVACLSEKRTCKQTCPSLRPPSVETTVQEDAVGWRGWARTGGTSLVLASGRGLLTPLHFRRKCV